MAAASTDDGADDGTLVHARSDLRKHLANLDAGDLGGDRFELAANLGWGLGLDLPHVLVGRAAAQEDVDDRFVPARRGAGASFGAEDVGERQSAGADSERADAQKTATIDAVTEAS